MDVGGSELNAVRTAEHLDRNRFDLRVACLRVDGPLRDRYRDIEVPVLHFPVRSFRGSSMATTGWRFAKYLRRERIQIVHSHDMYSNLFAVPWARLARGPVTIASRRWWYSLPSARLRMANTVAFRMAHSVLANSPQVGQSVREADGVAPDRIRVVTNFASDHAFTVLPSEVRTELRRDLGIPEGRIVVGCVGRLVPVKDHSTLLRAFALTLTSNPNVHLLIVGDGPCRASLVALADDLALGSAVTFAGQRLDTLNYYQLCDVSALASESEGFPNTLVEAMAARCPVVATNVGGNVDAVIDGDTGFLVPVGDVKGFADALDRLVRSPSLRSRMGAAGRDRAETNYRASAVIPSLEDMYDDLLAKYSSRRAPAPSGAAVSSR